MLIIFTGWLLKDQHKYYRTLFSRFLVENPGLVDTFSKGAVFRASIKSKVPHGKLLDWSDKYSVYRARRMEPNP